MPTDNSVQTTNGVAPVVPPANSTQPVLTEEQIKQIPYDLLKKSHPDVQTIETRYAAAHKEIDGKKTKKELEAEIARLKVLAGEATAPVTTQVAPGMQTLDATKIQEEVEWNIANKALVQAAGQTFYDNLAKGMDKQDALDLALARKPAAERAIAENLRAQITASGSGSVDRTTEPGPKVEGISKEYFQQLKAKFPDATDEQLQTIVNRSVQKTQLRGA